MTKAREIGLLAAAERASEVPPWMIGSAVPMSGPDPDPTDQEPPTLTWAEYAVTAAQILRDAGFGIAALAIALRYARANRA